MGAKVTDLRNRLEGRTLIGSPYAGPFKGPMRLWDYYTEPPAQQSILVYKNGDVWEKAEFTTDEINDPDVYLFIQGGTDFRCEPSGWLHDTLVAQGYECTSITEDVYLDGYTDQYPITEA